MYRRRAAKDVFKFEGKGVLAKAQKAMNAKANPLKTAQNLYQVEDDFFKIMHFEKTIDDLKKVFPKGTPIEVIEEEAARRAATLTSQMATANKAAGRGGYQSSFGKVDDFMSGSGEPKDMGSFADGGLATMFVEKR